MDAIVGDIIKLSEELNIDIYLVGGALRDLLLDRRIRDFDFAVARHHRKLIEAIIHWREGTLVVLDEERQIYRIVLKENITLDFSPMRGENIQEDLSQRDFTINAMAYNVKNGWPLDKKKILDPFNAVKDLQAKILRHVSNKVFQEDPVRMLRAVAFMAQLNFQLHKNTKILIQNHRNKITTVAGERVVEELFKILKEKRSYYYFNLMDKDLYLLECIFPEISEMKEVGQCKYHLVDSWTHSIYTMKLVESYIYAENFFEDYIAKAYQDHFSEIIAGDHQRFQLIKLGAFFHDIGKPSARWIDEAGRVRFKGHESVGAEIVKEYSNKLRLSGREKEILYKYVALHMWPLVLYKKNDVSGRTLYKAFNETSEETLDVLLIALGDIIATRKILEPYEEMGKFKVYIEYIASNYLTRYKPIENIGYIITGREVIEALNISQGTKVGEILQEVKRAIYFGEISPNKEEAISYIKTRC